MKVTVMQRFKEKFSYMILKSIFLKLKKNNMKINYISQRQRLIRVVFHRQGQKYGSWRHLQESDFAGSHEEDSWHIRKRL